MCYARKGMPKIEWSKKFQLTNSSQVCNEFIVSACAVRSSTIFCASGNGSEWIVADGDWRNVFADCRWTELDPGVVVKYGISVGKACRARNSANSRFSKTTCCKTFSYDGLAGLDCSNDLILARNSFNASRCRPIVCSCRSPLHCAPIATSSWVIRP